jgi:hypothetical protein
MNINQLVIEYVEICEKFRCEFAFDEFVELWLQADAVAKAFHEFSAKPVEGN